MSAEIAKSLRVLAANARQLAIQMDELAEKASQATPVYRKKVRQIPKHVAAKTILTKTPGLDIYQLVEALKKSKYVFVGGNPVASTRSMIYARPSEFKNVDGLFYLQGQ